MITILPILLAYEFIFIAPWQEILRRRWFLYSAMAAIWIVPLAIEMPVIGAHTTAGFNLPDRPRHFYWMTQAWVVLYYLTLCFIPDPLCFRYVDWPITTEFSNFFLGVSRLACCWS